MSLYTDWISQLPLQQQSLAEKCRHPSGEASEFSRNLLEQSVPCRFKTIVENHPSRIAVQSDSAAMAYTELNRLANLVADSILNQQGDDNSPVGVLLPNGISLMATLLGVWKAGKIVALLDPSFPESRIAAMLDQAGVRLVIGDQEAASRIGRVNPGLSWIDAGNLESFNTREIVQPVAPDDFACLFFTSGSTGEPKAVVLSHRNLLHQAMLFTHAYGICRHDRLALLSSGSGSAVGSALMAILNGAAVLPFDSRSNGVARLPSWLIEQRISLCLLGAPLFRNMCETLSGAEAFPDLRLLRLRSDSVHSRDLELFKKHFPRDCLLVNGLSSSETGLLTLWYFDHSSEPIHDDIPVGYAVQDKDVFLVDEAGERVGANQIGEIVVRSRYLPPGYWRKADLAQAKVKSEFGDQARLCFTGDLGLMRPDGCLIHKGRKDFRVKIRGFGVDLEEVQKTLRTCKSVRETVVVTQQTESEETNLVAYVVPVGPTPIALGELRKFLAERLPAYMIPAVFVTLETMPMTANGKIDRRALPEPCRVRTRLDDHYVAPSTDTENQLVKIWQEVLTVEPIGVEDNFFDLGGDSLSATRVIMRVRRLRHVSLTEQQLFDSPTIAAIAAHLEKQGSVKDRLAAPELMLTPRPGQLPLSFPQQRLWVLDQLDPGSAANNLFSAAHIKGELDVEALQRCFNEIVHRHEILRTVYQNVNGIPEQFVISACRVELPIVDLRVSGAEPERTAQLRRLYQIEAQRPFDLARGPLLRVKLVRYADGHHVLLLTVHHIVFDGWSRGILTSELSAIYSAFVTAAPLQLQALQLQYADFAHWQRAQLDDSVLSAHGEYWKQKLENLAPLKLPTDRPHPARLIFHGVRRMFSLPKELSRALKALADGEGATLFMALLSGWQGLFHRYTGQNDIAIGSPVAGRSYPEVENLIGFFLNILVLRGDLSGNPTFRELLARTRKTCLEAFSHQEFPFERLVEELDPQRTLDRHPLVQVMFAFQNSPQSAWSMAGLNVEEIDVDPGISRFDLNLFVENKETGLRICVEHNPDLFHESTIDRMIGHYQTFLEKIVVNPDLRVSELPFLGQAERNRLLVDWNDTKRAYPKDKCIHHLFEEQVERTPEAVAMVFGEQQLTYRDLNIRANRLAHYLRKQGIRPEVLVGIWVERSIEMLVGLLGILKAGGAYVPIDPGFPAERVKFMLADAQVSVLLTQQSLVEDGGLKIENSDPRSSILDLRIQVIYLDRDWGDISKEPSENVKRKATAENLAYVIYTSGSTGQPKGVAIEHRNAVALLSWAHSAFTQEDLSRVLAATSICFDLSVFEIFAPLTCGGTIILAENALALATISKTSSVSLLNTVPSALTELLRLEAIPASVRTINLAGEALRPDLVRRIYESTAVDKVYDLYGPSECTTYSTWTCREADGRQTVGRPIANTRVYILDGYRNPVPIGMVGEIYIGGDGVARGYLNRPELTAECFIHHSFDQEPEQRLYETGDLARYLPDGNIELLGRIDNQVKIRGYRIELGEIESVLSQHSAVRESVVAVKEDSAGEKRLVAYVVPQESASANSELRAYLKAKLPDYLVPSFFVMLEALPLTSNGKVDRSALPSPDRVVADSKQVYVGPRTSAEKTIAETWEEVLGRTRVGIYDNFFDLGGHSLKATQVVSRLRTAFQSEIPLSQLFEFPTIAELAAAIDSKARAELKNDNFAELLTEIETMLEEEARDLLAKERNG